MVAGFRRWLFIGAVGAIFVGGVPVAAAQDTETPEAKCKRPSTTLLRVDAAIVTLNQQKSWQPRSGDVDFSIAVTKALPADATFLVCFGWQVQGQMTADFMPARQTRLVATAVEGARTVYKLSAVVPGLGPAPPRFADGASAGVYTAFMIVPVADLRVLAYDATGKSFFLDERAAIGITSRTLAAIVAVVVILAALAVCCWALPPLPAGVRVNPILRLISNSSGYASLSQFQIMLWTFLVGGAAVYVMALSGDLIVISAGTLVLLGISGVAVVGTQAKTVSDEKAVAEQAADALKKGLPPPVPPPPRIGPPQWSDLIASAEEPIDVTRLQMLFFTLIAAAFVTMKVVVSYVIPEIPAEFQTLIGISNGVYMGSKFVRKP